MVFKSIVGITWACLITISLNANAIPISVDWKSTGDGKITYDATSKLEWLDLTETTNRSYQDISTKFGTGMEFAGWRYAHVAEVKVLWTSFGGSGIYNGWRVDNNGLFDIIAPLMGDTYCSTWGSCTAGEGYSSGMTADVISPGFRFIGFIYDTLEDPLAASYDLFSTSGFRGERYPTVTVGSYLVRNAVVQASEPPIVILMASGIIAFWIVRRKSRI